MNRKETDEKKKSLKITNERKEGVIRTLEERRKRGNGGVGRGEEDRSDG